MRDPTPSETRERAPLVEPVRVDGAASPEVSAHPRQPRGGVSGLHEVVAVVVSITTFAIATLTLGGLCVFIGYALSDRVGELHVAIVVGLRVVWWLLLTPIVTLGGATALALRTHERVISSGHSSGAPPRVF